MELSKFKSDILDNTLDTKVVICKYSGNGDFLFHQYLNHYAKTNNLDIEYVDDISSISNSSGLFDVPSSVIYVHTTDIVDKNTHIPCKTNLWIKTKKVDKVASDKYSNYIVECPKLEQWQIKDYIMSITKLSEKYTDEIIDTYKDNIFRIELEVAKLTLFDDCEKMYDAVKDQLYVDTSNYGVYDLINAIIRKDLNTLKSVLSNIDNIDVEPFGLLKLLTDNFRRIIDVQLNPKATAESTGLSSKQFWAIKKYSCGYYTREQLFQIYKLLTECDYRIKSGKLDTNILVNYLINRILTY